MKDPIPNKVKNSGIITLNLEDFLGKEEMVSFDISTFLIEGLLLKEKDFREKVKNWDVSNYKNKIVAVECSTDAIIPEWSYLLITEKLLPVAWDVYIGNVNDGRIFYLYKALENIDYSQYTHKSIIINGCSNQSLPIDLLNQFFKRCLPYARSIMFGEACSAVPLYKKSEK